jgi:hypothetical protein
MIKAVYGHQLTEGFAFSDREELKSFFSNQCKLEQGFLSVSSTVVPWQLYELIAGIFGRYKHIYHAVLFSAK